MEELGQNQPPAEEPRQAAPVPPQPGTSQPMPPPASVVPPQPPARYAAPAQAQRPSPAPQPAAWAAWQQGAPPAGRPPVPPPTWQAPPPGQWGPPPGQWQQPPQAPAPRKSRRSILPIVIALVIMGFIGFTALVGMMGMGAGSGGSGFSMPFGEKIVLLEIEGVLGEGELYPADTARLKGIVRKWAEDDSVKGMVIRINSPGGAVSATHDLYEAVQEFRAADKPVYASMGDVAASGGYYMASAADRVYANSGTLTGSVGVILSFWGYKDLVNKVGLEARTIKSGQFKDIGSGSRDLTEEERQLLDEMVVDVFEQFFDIVHDARHDSARDAIAARGERNPDDVTDEEIEQHLRSYCDGRIFSGRQALEYGFVDELGTLDDAVEAMREDLGLSEKATIVHTPKPPPKGLFGIAKQKMEALDHAMPGGAKLEYRFTM